MSSKVSRCARQFGTEHFAGEFVFVPYLGNAEKDGGWLIGLVIHAGGTTTML